MSESVETIAVIFALCATIWLALGLALSQLLRKWPARAHGVLVAAQTGALITPLLYLTIQQANWGLLPVREAPTQVSVSSREEPPQSLFEPQPIPTGSEEISQLESMNGGVPEGIPADPVGRFQEIADRTDPVQEVPEPILPQVPEVSPPPSFSLKGLFLWAWLGASALMLLRLCLDFLAGYRLAGRSRPLKDASTTGEIAALACKLGLTRAPLLVLSDNIASPVLWGWSRPARILIPIATRENSATRGVYLHELAHLARRDHLSALLGEIVCCLIPWHPLAWRAKRSMETRAEEACDDWVVASGYQVADYAEELVHLAPSRARVLTMAAVSKSSRLKSRISRLLQGVFSSPRLGRRWMVGVGLAALLLTGLLSILQQRSVQAGTSESTAVQSDLETPQGSPITPSATDATEAFVVAEGKPVAGAKVWLRRQAETTWGLTWEGPLMSDQAGRVEFGVEKGMAFDAVAIDEKGRLGKTYLRRTIKSKPEPKIILEPTTTIEGVIVHLGKPVSGVQCKSIGVLSKGSAPQGYDFPDRFWPGEVRSDEQGRIRVPLVPKGYGVRCEFTDERFAWNRTLLSSETANTISLEKAGRLELEFEGAANPVRPAQYSWDLTVGQSKKNRFEGNEGYMSSLLNGDHPNSMKGNIITRIKPGKYNLDIKNTAISPYLFHLKQDLEIKPDQVTKIKIPTKEGVQVTGRIVDATTGKGVPHYRFSLYSSHQLRSDRTALSREARADQWEWANGITDQAGNYEVYVRGKARYGFVYHSSHNMSTDLDRYRLTRFDMETLTYGVQAEIPESGKFTFPDLLLPPSQKVKGLISNNQGRSLTGEMEVFDPSWPWKHQDHWTERELKNGSFEWIGIPPQKALNLRIRQGKAVNIPVELSPAQWKDGLKIALDEGNAVTFVGQVQDEEGHPVPKTHLYLFWHFLIPEEGGPVNGRQLMETMETDEQGRFKLKGHWPKERYYLHVENPRYIWPGFVSPLLSKEKTFADSDEYKLVVDVSMGKKFHMNDMKMGQPGETVDYGIIRLVKSTKIVRGKVVGLNGLPIPGIQMIAVAEGEGPLNATTDAQGQFQVGQLRGGNGFLIAKGAGYRATYVPFQTGGNDLVIQVRRSTEAPVASPIISKEYLAAREKMLRHVLESIWKTRQTSGWGARMLESMVALDPARARLWLEQATPQEKSNWSEIQKPMTYEEAVRLALINVDDGIAAAKKIRPDRAIHLVLVGERLLKTHPELSLRFAEEAVVQFRAMGPTRYFWKAPGLVEAGALVWKAGKKESGRQLMQEGIDVLQKDPQNQSFQDSNAAIAAFLAPIDWPLAVKHLDLSADAYKFNYALLGCIQQIAKDDPAGAKGKTALFKEEKDVISSFPVKCRLDLAKRIAETDLEGALKVLEEIKKAQAFTHSYAQGLTELAVQIHPKDPARAYRLIDQAFDFLDQFDQSEERKGWGPICSLLGAQMVYLARQIDYPDPHALVARTLGYLGKPPVEEYPSEKENWRQTVIALALTDPLLAKKVLQMHTSVDEIAKEWSGGDEPSQRSRNRRESGFILALIDPEKTIAVFDSMTAKGWTSEMVSSAAISEIFNSFAKKGDLMKNINHWELLMWMR